MKSVMIVIDGLGDEPIDALAGRTPLEAAFAPNIHYIANRGGIGQLRTTFPGFPVESMVCIMGLLGYDPSQFYPSGRASFEAMAKGIPLHPCDLVLRCNIVTVDPDTQVMTDFTAGLIPDSHARSLVSRISLPHPNWELYPGQSYRNVLILRGADIDPRDIACREPHMNIGQPITDMLPSARTPKARELVTEIGEFLLDTQRQIREMGLGDRTSGNMLWTWSPSRKAVWPSFAQRTGLSSGVVGGLDFLHGIAMAAGMHFDVIPGATGYIDTDYRAKAAYTIKYLHEYDFVLTHINAADEEAHQHNHAGKTRAIELTDELIVGPVLRELQARYPGDFRIVLCGDHQTRCRDGKHTEAFVPYAMYGKAVPPSNAAVFSEAACACESPIPSLAFLNQMSRC